MDFDWISDIDECNDASLNQCTFPNLCVNVDGSYNCSCPDYHVLENDGRTCKGYLILFLKRLNLYLFQMYLSLCERNITLKIKVTIVVAYVIPGFF